jgi:hypothetical protein
MQLRLAIRQDNVASDAQGCLLECGMHRVAKSVAGGHQRCGRQHVGAIQLQNGVVHAFCQSKIIGVYDEAAFCRLGSIHATSLASGDERRFFAVNDIDPNGRLPYTQESLYATASMGG